MGKLGVSVYPERSTFEQDAAYLDLAAHYGFKRVFTSMLEIKGDQETVLANFKAVIDHANALDMEVMVDMNPALFAQLGVSYDNLAFFHELGAYGIRLDLGFTGAEEAKMTRNPFDLKIEVNMSQGTHYIDNIMAFSPKRENLLGSHNFYPHRYSGLGQDFFDYATRLYTQYNLNTAAFVNSHAATFGPWPTQDGLSSLESHRDLPIATQVTHYVMMDTIDDLIIGNAYASEAELKAMAEAFNAEFPSLQVVPNSGMTDLERTVIFDNLHSYRGDRSEYLLRSTQTRVKYAGEPFPAHDTELIRRGDVLIDNDGYGQYKGETQIALQPMPNDGRVNVVGHLAESDLFLLNYLRPWSNFKLSEAQ
ncbi:DUF871 domain-containing protein [Lacticaseibacillus brantae]|uniref:Outer surface protein n=1 Tax=Lacticaseibacillus brantae DSM 23927 TaxID=1423727 RepID=A0A0R2B010_9LACO|nr:DUF871 domain-containing protein [Lacticaseibacillus brantae]KRM72575.1 hypothetical protein FC34_GL000283 [Lacticaseibacillus brantae DSM 23927]